MTNDDTVSTMRGRIDGAILIGSACLAVLAMMHHPQVVAHNAHDALREISDKSVADEIVHGALMFLVSVQAVAYFGIAHRLGWTRLSTQCGAMAYWIGLLFVLLAALVDGFVIPDLVSLQNFSAEDEHGALPALYFCTSIIRMATAAGLVAMSAGMIFWSASLLGKSRRKLVFGITGLAINAVVAFAILLGIFHLDLKGALALIILQSCWHLVAGIGCWRGDM